MSILTITAESFEQSHVSAVPEVRCCDGRNLTRQDLVGAMGPRLMVNWNKKQVTVLLLLARWDKRRMILH